MILRYTKTAAKQRYWRHLTEKAGLKLYPVIYHLLPEITYFLLQDLGPASGILPVRYYITPSGLDKIIIGSFFYNNDSPSGFNFAGVNSQVLTPTG